MGTMTRFNDLHLSPAPKAVLLGFIILIFAFSPTLSHVSQLDLDGTSIAHPNVNQPRDASSWGKIPLFFIANQGQLDSRVAYYVPGSDKSLYFTPGGITIALGDISHNHTTRSRGEYARSRYILKLEFMEANAVRPIGQEMNQAVISYFKGKPGEWRTGLPTFSKISYHNLWEGIDLAYSGNVDRLKYEFVLQPGADPKRIRLVYHGATLSMNQQGQLSVSTPIGGFQDDVPVAYQDVDGKRVPVTMRYTLSDNITYGFSLGSYDPNLPLVIDPAILVYCGFIGGSDSDWGYGIAIDSAGNAYITGETFSTEESFPETVGPYLTYNGGTMDAFVAKIKADGSGLVYAGYIGGSESDQGNSIAVDSAGNAYITGNTQSTEETFPVLNGPDLESNGGSDAFVVKVKSDGTGLDYAGFIGGENGDSGNSISVDSSGGAYITGYTASDETTFPDLIGPDLSYNGDGDAFIAKVTADGCGLAYAGYIGGSGSDQAKGIAVDTNGNAFIAGTTSSTQTTFPETVGPDLSYNMGTSDAFVAKVNSAGSGLVYAGYLGGVSVDEGYGIAIDSSGSAYVAGRTSSGQASFPVLVGPDLTYNGGSSDIFVAKIKNDGTGFVYAGYIGGNDWEFGYAIGVDSLGSAYLTGYTFSTETTFPVVGGLDLTHNGGYWDAYVAKVKADGIGLVYCGYLGGENSDIGQGIAVDAEGSTYVVGATKSNEATFPEAVGPDLIMNGERDAFVAKVTYSPDDINTYLPLVVR